MLTYGTKNKLNFVSQESLTKNSQQTLTIILLLKSKLSASGENCMKNGCGLVVFVILGLLLFNVLSSGISLTVRADFLNTITVQFYNIGASQTSLTNETTHSSPYAAKLVLSSQGSACMVMYPYNKSLNSLQSFQVYTSYINASPRFVMFLDTNGDGLTDIALLSDYQLTSDGNWQLTQGGQRWGWSEASPTLATYGKTWNIFSYWKGIYGNATVISVGVALEYWGVKDSNGFDQPLYTDEVILNGLTYNIDSALNQSIINPPPPLSTTEFGSLKLDNRLYGQASLTNETIHSDPYSAKLVIPSTATPNSCAMALYSYNRSLNTLASFSVWASFTTAVPRFVIYVDNNSDGLTDFILLSDYQFVSNGSWQITTGGNRWGWTQANYQLNNYGTTWNQLDYWKNQYGNCTALYVGICLEYWGVYDRGGSDQPLYADEFIINGVTYNINASSMQLPINANLTPLPTATVSSIPSPTPSLAPANTTKPIPPQSITIPNATATPTPNQDPIPISTTQPTKPILAVEPLENGSDDSILLAIITTIALIAIVSLALIFKRNNNNSTKLTSTAT